MDRKNQRHVPNLPIFLGGPMGPIHPVWALAAIHPGWGNRYVLSFGQLTKFCQIDEADHIHLRIMSNHFPEYVFVYFP